MNRPLVEICCPSLDQARKAFAVGADRVELCREIDCGGLTPTDEALKAIPSLPGPVHVLIRCRAGNFVYDEAEILCMLEQIDRAADCGAAGVVVGALTADGAIDKAASQRLITHAREQSLSVTFHRAIDETADYMSAYKDVCALAPDRILTSGGFPTAFEGRFRLAGLIQAPGPVILPGKGITGENVRELLLVTGAREVHGTCLDIANYPYYL